MLPNKTRVLIVIPALVAGGAERVITTLVRNLSRDRLDMTLVVVNQDHSVFDDDLPADIPIIYLKVSRLRYAIPELIKLVWKIRPDVVFSTIDYLNITLATIRPTWPRPTRFIARPSILLSAVLRRQSRPSYWRMLHKLALINTDLLVFQSNEMQRDYYHALGQSKGPCVVIPNPLDLAFVRERASVNPTVMVFDSKGFHLVAAGRLEEQKGFDIAIEAVAHTNSNDIHLTIIGDGSLRRKLEEHTKALGVDQRVRFLGYQHNPYPFYAKADGYLLSSRFEGFPNVVLEAIACGTPVVATPLAGLSEMLDGIPECRLSKDHTAISLAEAIGDFVALGRQRVKPDVVRHYDVGQVVPQYERILSHPANWQDAGLMVVSPKRSSEHQLK
jgi:glycosyltransferase involved in cell wall biosynthesis